MKNSQEKMQEQVNVPGEHEKISYTAIGVAYARNFSDIPYSKEISDICDASNLTPENAEIHHKMAPYFEARFKSLTNLLEQSGIKNVLEVASGVGPRDLILTENPEINYIETDLPDMLRQKQGILTKLLESKGLKLPRNLHFSELNVLDKESFTKVAAQFPNGPIAIGHEGLLAYFSREEKHRMGQIIHDILTDRGGVWITPDIYTLEDLSNLQSDSNKVSDSNHRKALEEVKRRTGRDYSAYAFSNLDDAKDFFDNLGFDFSINTIGEVADEIASSKIGLDEESVKKQLAIKIWQLRPKK
jgi:O-methyltransferase involved in polyketide biosynthesis